MKFKKKPVVIDAEQWQRVEYEKEAGPGPSDFPIYKLGVGYYRNPSVDGMTKCRCGETMHNHGWINTLEGGHIVCPGDYVITGIAGERYPCKPNIFAATYDPEDYGVSDEELAKVDLLGMTTELIELRQQRKIMQRALIEGAEHFIRFMVTIAGIPLMDCKSKEEIINGWLTKAEQGGAEDAKGN